MRQKWYSEIDLAFEKDAHRSYEAGILIPMGKTVLKSKLSM